MKTSIISYSLLVGIFSIGTSSKVIDLSDLDTAMEGQSLFNEVYNKTVEWGVYKPDLYFGVKNRQENPLAFGLFWYNYDKDKTPQVNSSYAYDMDNGVTAYYQFNDGTSASRQLIKDEKRQIQYKIEFHKEMEQIDQTPTEYISRWTSRITINAQDGQQILGNPVFFAAKEGKLNNEAGTFKITQNTKKNFYKIQHTVDPTNNIYEMIEIGAESQIDDNSMLAVNKPDDQTWQLDKLWATNYDQYSKAHGLIDTTTPNICMIRPTLPSDGLQILVRYSKQKFASEAAADAYTEIMEKDIADVQKDIDSKMTTAESNFKARYLQIFGEGYKDFLRTMPDALMFGQETLAQLLGGIGYFYGPIRILDNSPQGWSYDQPAGLFTATPSRPFFPRGFLWDEGFHSQITCQWSKMLCMDILAHWFNSIKENGWIPREQMRGKEAESSLNYNLAENPKAGNPPSFMFVLEYLLDSLQQKQDQRVIDFLTNIFPRVELWFSWFDTTLGNTDPALKGTYMWMDVGKEGALSSGLDDYPRGWRQSQKANVHNDLQLWMKTFSKFMADFIDEIKTLTGKTVSKKSSDDYRNQASLIQQQHRTWCYNEETGLFTDRIIYHDDPTPDNIFDKPQVESSQHILRLRDSRRLDVSSSQSKVARKYRQINQFSPHQGIVNLFPVALNGFQGMIERLDDHLMFGVDTETLNSPYGLRGVSAQDMEYFPGTGYWRGPVWISVNYLVLRGLYKYYLDYTPVNPLSEDGTIKTPKDFYQQLRQKIVQVVYDNWEPQHLLYENFNDVTGKGQSSHPFSGWTTLVLLIMNERYI
ncbi:mannosyl-oligosaccharide glucosidase [Stylonychia lemnae]|uniref:Mannosyl-oligosaccharide glucosidase n=1 Tax=Stylonychia lemnae TaxID=5949 RepID=A0A078BA37_STYLE|nr:mannosyl-oligosaccharide glucosidase [Stylonychia lemnae]|eukprot:CDW90142.1 mannosyl-oligosaccharide glucosidase [Stylonychia lemnae]